MSCSAYLKRKIYYMPFKMAEILKTQAIVDVCDPCTYEIARNVFSIDQGAYDEYKKDFIKSNGTPEKKIWHVFSDQINDL